MGRAFLLCWVPFSFWSHLPVVLAYAQLPLCLLVYTTLFGSLLVAYALERSFNHGMRLEHIIASVLLVGLAAGPYLYSPEAHPTLSVAKIIARPQLGSAANQMYQLANVVAPAVSIGTNRPIISAEEIFPKTKYGTITTAEVDIGKASVVQLPVLFYPDVLKVRANGKVVPYEQMGRLVAVDLPPGHYQLDVMFAGLDWANKVSLVGWVIVILALVILATARIQKGFGYNTVPGRTRRPALHMIGLVILLTGVGIIGMLATPEDWLLHLPRPTAKRSIFQAVSTIDMQIAFRAIIPGAMEPIVATSHDGVDPNMIIVRHVSDTQIRFGLYGSNNESPVITIKPDHFYPVKIQFDALQKQIALMMDEQRVLWTNVELMPFTRDDIVVGANPSAPPITFTNPNPTSVAPANPNTSPIASAFSGMIFLNNAISEQPIPATKDSITTWTMSVIFSRQHFNDYEPIVTTGITGAGDFLSMFHPLDGIDGSTRVAFDHWGEQTVLGVPLILWPGRTYVVTVTLDRAKGRVMCRVDGQVALDVPVQPYPFTPAQVTLGTNTIGGGAVGARLSGSLALMTPKGAVPLVISGQPTVPKQESSK